MSQRKNAARRAARGYTGPKGTLIQIPSGELKNRIDVLIGPGVSPQDVPGGWIEMSANAKGREAIERIFPAQTFCGGRVRMPDGLATIGGRSLRTSLVRRLAAPTPCRGI